MGRYEGKHREKALPVRTTDRQESAVDKPTDGEALRMLSQIVTTIKTTQAAQEAAETARIQAAASAAERRAAEYQAGLTRTARLLSEASKMAAAALPVEVNTRAPWTYQRKAIHFWHAEHATAFLDIRGWRLLERHECGGEDVSLPDAQYISCAPTYYREQLLGTDGRIYTLNYNSPRGRSGAKIMEVFPRPNLPGLIESYVQIGHTEELLADFLIKHGLDAHLAAPGSEVAS